MLLEHVPCHTTVPYSSDEDSASVEHLSAHPLLLPARCVLLRVQETFSRRVGDAHSVRLRDLAAKRSGIRAVPHIELWRDFHPRFAGGVDCRVAPPHGHEEDRPRFLREGGSVSGSKDAPIVRSGLAAQTSAPPFAPLSPPRKHRAEGRGGAALSRGCTPGCVGGRGWGGDWDASLLRR